MAEFVLTPAIKQQALRSLADLRGETVFIVNKTTSKPIRLGNGGNVTANGGLGTNARFRVRRTNKQHRHGPVVRFECVANGKFLAIKNGQLTHGGGGEHCHFIVEQKQAAVLLRKHQNPKARMGFNGNGQPAPANSLGEGDRARFFIFDCDQVVPTRKAQPVRHHPKPKPKPVHHPKPIARAIAAATNAIAHAIASSPAPAPAPAPVVVVRAPAPAPVVVAAPAPALPVAAVSAAVVAAPVVATAVGGVQIFENRTPPNANGGSCIYLDRHAVQCPPGQVLCGFKLTRPPGNKLGYLYWSLNVNPALHGPQNIGHGQTPPNADGGGKNIYLDRHHVMAPGNALLSGFQLVRVGGTKYHYKFNFVHNAGVGDVIEKETQGNADGNGNVIYLDRHALKAPAGWGLKGFKLIRPTSGNIAYRYWIQKVVA